MKHTPGEWILETESIEHDGEYVEPTIWSAPDDSGVRRHIAVIRVGLEGTEANAHLIAAAPELLNALKYALKYGDGCIAGEDCGPECCWYGRTRALVAKAEGAQ